MTVNTHFKTHEMIDTGHVREKLVLKVAELALDRVGSNPDVSS